MLDTIPLHTSSQTGRSAGRSSLRFSFSSNGEKPLLRTLAARKFSTQQAQDALEEGVLQLLRAGDDDEGHNAPHTQPWSDDAQRFGQQSSDWTPRMAAVSRSSSVASSSGSRLSWPAVHQEEKQSQGYSTGVHANADASAAGKGTLFQELSMWNFAEQDSSAVESVEQFTARQSEPTTTLFERRQLRNSLRPKGLSVGPLEATHAAYGPSDALDWARSPSSLGTATSSTLPSTPQEDVAQHVAAAAQMLAMLSDEQMAQAISLARHLVDATVSAKGPREAASDSIIGNSRFERQQSWTPQLPCDHDIDVCGNLRPLHQWSFPMRHEAGATRRSFFAQGYDAGPNAHSAPMEREDRSYTLPCEPRNYPSEMTASGEDDGLGALGCIADELALMSERAMSEPGPALSKVGRSRELPVSVEPAAYTTRQEDWWASVPPRRRGSSYALSASLSPRCGSFDRFTVRDHFIAEGDGSFKTSFGASGWARRPSIAQEIFAAAFGSGVHTSGPAS